MPIVVLYTINGATAAKDHKMLNIMQFALWKKLWKSSWKNCDYSVEIRPL